ncbi:hypothetical protein MG293_000012 [Ovis ammon polii]|uniref:Uncharacterized protein n=1 Tax=Ovis ammon polii TaxID=230172 RepID=A0AAD4UJI0_OVIAM|nr:hypothetical protein MG293_000012 [Ovis ammon polii]
MAASKAVGFQDGTFQEDKTRCLSTCQPSAHIKLAEVLLVNATHMFNHSVMSLVLLNLCTFHEERVSGHAEASIKRFTRKIHSVLLHAWIPDTGVPHLVFRILVDRTLLFLVSQAYNRNLL